MKIIDLLDQPDGSVVTHVDLSSEEVSMLLEYALVTLLEEATEDGRLKRPEGDGDASQQE